MDYNIWYEIKYIICYIFFNSPPEIRRYIFYIPPELWYNMYNGGVDSFLIRPRNFVDISFTLFLLYVII